jgi:hypothetical protein
VAEERGDFAAAEGWVRKAIEIFKRLGDEYSAKLARQTLQRIEVEPKST